MAFKEWEQCVLSFKKLFFFARCRSWRKPIDCRRSRPRWTAGVRPESGTVDSSSQESCCAADWSMKGLLCGKHQEQDWKVDNTLENRQVLTISVWTQKVSCNKQASMTPWLHDCAAGGHGGLQALTVSRDETGQKLSSLVWFGSLVFLREHVVGNEPVATKEDIGPIPTPILTLSLNTSAQPSVEVAFQTRCSGLFCDLEIVSHFSLCACFNKHTDKQTNSQHVFLFVALQMLWSYWWLTSWCVFRRKTRSTSFHVW